MFIDPIGKLYKKEIIEKNNLKFDEKEKFVVILNITSTQLIKMRANQFHPEEYNEAQNVICSVGRFSNLRPIHTIRDKVCFSAISFLEIVLHALA